MVVGEPSESVLLKAQPELSDLVGLKCVFENAMEKQQFPVERVLFLKMILKLCL